MLTDPLACPLALPGAVHLPCMMKFPAVCADVRCSPCVLIGYDKSTSSRRLGRITQACQSLSVCTKLIRRLSGLACAWAMHTGLAADTRCAAVAQVVRTCSPASTISSELCSAQHPRT